MNVTRNSLQQISIRFGSINCDTGGLIWVAEWNSLQHPVGASFLALMYSDYMLTSRTAALHCGNEVFTPADLRKFAASQVINLLYISNLFHNLDF